MSEILYFFRYVTVKSWPPSPEIFVTVCHGSRKNWNQKDGCTVEPLPCTLFDLWQIPCKAGAEKGC